MRSRIPVIPGLRSVLVAFCVSRAIVVAVLILGSQIAVPTPDPESSLYEPDIILPDVPTLLEKVRRTVDIGDASWYIVTATYGYEQSPFDATEQHNWAFFPVYPLLLHAAASLTGEFQLTGMVLSSACFFVALVLLYQYALARGLDPPAAERAVLYQSIYPTAYFFSLPTTEAVFLLVTLSAFLAAQQRKWWMAGIAGAISSATRAAGILVFPALATAAALWLVHCPARWPRAAGVVLVPLGVMAFMVVLASDTGNAWAFRDVQAAWGRSPDLHAALVQLRDVATHPAELSRSWDFRLLNASAVVLGLGCALGLVMRREWDLAIYTLGCVALPLTTGSLQSLARFVMVLFPVSLMLAIAGRNSAVDTTIRSVFAVLLGILTALFAAHFTIALA